MRVDPQRPPRQKDSDDRNALAMQPAQQLQVRPVARTVLDRAGIALELGIRIFPEHDDGDTGARLEVAARIELGRPAGRLHGAQYAGKNGFGVREIHVGNTRALPGDRPPPALLANTVGAVAGNEYVLCRLQWQQMVRVLQQDQGLAYRTTCDSAVLGRPQQLKLPGQRPRRRSPFVKQMPSQLNSQDAS